MFWPVFEDQLDALLNPDYTDEEIRREVRNFGVDKADDGKLHLEEKGTVYNEMVRTYEAPDTNLWRDGRPARLRHEASARRSTRAAAPTRSATMTPEDIRTFHEAAYHLANMGMIGAFPSSMSLGERARSHRRRSSTRRAGRKGTVMSEADLPKPRARRAGTIEVVDYPYATTTNPGPMMLAWPATRDLDRRPSARCSACSSTRSPATRARRSTRS